MSLQKEIDRKKQNIQTGRYSLDIGAIISMYREGEIDLHPEFQRFFRWNRLQKSRFIESLLLGIPIPSIFVYQRDNGVWDVIDGVQRLSTIFEFVGILRDEKGKQHKKYPYKSMMTPYEKFKFLPESEKYLKNGVTFEIMDKIAYAITDNESADRLQKARQQLFKTIDERELNTG